MQSNELEAEASVPVKRLELAVKLVSYLQWPAYTILFFTTYAYFATPQVPPTLWRVCLLIVGAHSAVLGWKMFLCGRIRRGQLVMASSVIMWACALIEFVKH